MAEGSARNLRRGLLLALAAELGFGGWQLLAVSGYEVKLVRLEEEYQIEWTVKKMEDSENPVYGIRLNPDRLELEFYHREPVEALFDRVKTKK